MAWRRSYIARIWLASVAIVAIIATITGIVLPSRRVGSAQAMDGCPRCRNRGDGHQRSHAAKLASHRHLLTLDCREVCAVGRITLEEDGST